MRKMHPRAAKIVVEIRSMKIRGAGRIARAAAQALSIAASHSSADTKSEFLRDLEDVSRSLLSTRPTAVSLPNAIGYVMNRVRSAESADVVDLKRIATEACKKFQSESREAIKRIGQIGAGRISDGDTILTHCNSEAVLSIISTAHKASKKLHVYVTESRPSYQGRITAKALTSARIPTTLIVDSAVRYFMNEIDEVIVGSDAIAANGAVVNKIGTSVIALAANEARTPFMVAAETYKFSHETLYGQLVEIEERAPTEVLSPAELRRMPGLTVRNPVFDITPPDLVDLIITEKGVIPPQAVYSEIVREYGWMPATIGRLRLSED